MNFKKFVRELQRQGKVKLIQGSLDVSLSYAQKSKNSYKAAKILFKQGLIEESISMSYYSMYNKLLSLLYRVGIKSENHSFSINLLKGIFGFENKQIIFAKKERIDKQYYPNFKLTNNDAKNLIDIAEEFNAELDLFIDKISIEELKSYRTKLKELLK